MPWPLKSTDWLASRLGESRLVVIDGSWHMPGSERSAEAEYLAEHIPGAVRFDIDAIADHDVDLPHMLPSLQDFADAMGRLGIDEDSVAVVYDSLGLFSAARVWWTLRTFGMGAFVLDGGLPKWKAESRLLESGPVARTPRLFSPKFDAEAVLSADEVLAAARSGTSQIIDARARERFTGAAPEPRPGLRRGHIPGSLNLPWTQLVEDGRLLPAEILSVRFSESGLDLSKPIVTTCGSGVTAAILALGLEGLDCRSAHYDGSWAEWGGRKDLPVETG